jgi:DNA phosphorothioation-dependent restriction protein DptF
MSKSSPYAVSTERDTALSVHLDEVKRYLYIETDIETDFKRELTGLSPTDKKIIFLCGSSGDGKSEILTRYNKDYATRADFHLDATHSFRPNDSAIQTLDELFTNFENSTRPLVIGVNIGMLGNYAQGGRVGEITSSINAFINKQATPENHIYLDFEDYPKFSLEINGHTSKFAKQLLQRITADKDNLLRQFYDKELLLTKPDKKLCTNYILLSMNAIQDVIIDLLFKTRLMKDQFLTARALLDFIFHLLAGPGYLFDNLFNDGDNDLASKIAEFDPANIRTQKIDQFILAQTLKLSDDKFNDYITALTEKGLRKGQKPESYLRLFYVLRKSDFSNNYHQQFDCDFNEQLLDNYSEIWHLHTSFDGSTAQKSKLRRFYRETAIAAIRSYNNRNAPNLNKSAFFISEHNGYNLAVNLGINPDISVLNNITESSPAFFTAHFKVDDKTIPLTININLFNLMQRIVAGYRPNKYDKNTVVLLDELIDEIVEIANKAKTLSIVAKGQAYEITNLDDDYFEVSGI